jgi:hypothetical protein
MVKEGAIMIFKQYMLEGTMDPEVQAVFKAAADISNGVFTLTEAAKFYKVHPAVIVQFIAESAEYDMIFHKGDKEQ